MLLATRRKLIWTRGPRWFLHADKEDKLAALELIVMNGIVTFFFVTLTVENYQAAIGVHFDGPEIVRRI